MTPTTPSPISHERAFHIALVLEMSELSDRNSPEDDPSAMVADSNEIAGCIERALERADLVLVPPTAPTTGSAPEMIRFDFINADGNEDSKVISHDEMRERYANMYLGAHSNFAAPASSAASVHEAEWIAKVKRELMMSKMTHNFTFSRDQVIEMLGGQFALLAASMGGEKA